MNNSFSQQRDPLEIGNTAKAIIANRVIIVIWRFLLIAAGIIGVEMNTSNLAGFVAKLTFFTIQSNVLLIIYMAYALWSVLQRREPSPFIGGAVTLYISITGLIYNFLLVRVVPPDLLLIRSPLQNSLLHTVTPVMAVIDWFLFERHGPLHWRYPFLWLAYPAAYFVFTLVRGAMITSEWFSDTIKYPYPFLDVDKIGYGGAILNFVILGTGFWLLGMAFVGVDQLLARFRGESSRQ